MHADGLASTAATANVTAAVTIGLSAAATSDCRHGKVAVNWQLMTDATLNTVPGE